MARVFRASDQDYVYLVHRTDKNLYALSYVKLDEVKRSFRQPIVPQRIELPWYDQSMRFRITVSRMYLYLYNRRAMWRVNHEDLLKTRGVWQPVQPPSGYMTDPDANLANPDANPSGLKPAGLWSPNIAGWWSNGLNDLHAWSDDHVVAVLSNAGEMWMGNFVPANRIWQDFQVTHILGGRVPEAGQSGIFITQVGGTAGGTLHFGVFDSSGKMVADTDETKLRGRPELARLKVQLTAADIRLGLRPLTQAESRDQAATVAALVGATWQWKQISGGARRMMKIRHASFDLCNRLREDAASLRAGRSASAQSTGA
jgi:hypothetical protein